MSLERPEQQGGGTQRWGRVDLPENKATRTLVELAESRGRAKACHLATGAPVAESLATRERKIRETANNPYAVPLGVTRLE